MLDITHDAEVVMRSDRVYVLNHGKISESGTPADLSWRAESDFATLFPELATQIRKMERRKKERVGTK